MMCAFPQSLRRIQFVQRSFVGVIAVSKHRIGLTTDADVALRLDSGRHIRGEQTCRHAEGHGLQGSPHTNVRWRHRKRGLRKSGSLLKSSHDHSRKDLSRGLPRLTLLVVGGQGPDEADDRFEPVPIVKALAGLASGFLPGRMREPRVVEGAEAGGPTGVVGFRIGMMMNDDGFEPAVDPG